MAWVSGTEGSGLPLVAAIREGLPCRAVELIKLILPTYLQEEVSEVVASHSDTSPVPA